jgi:2-methylcitrate dehydratase PrpD
MVKRVTCQVSGEMDGVQGLVQISTGDKVFTTRASEFAYGNPENPISQESLVTKFKKCAAYAANRFSDNVLNSLIENITHLEELHSFREITLF